MIKNALKTFALLLFSMVVAHAQITVSSTQVINVGESVNQFTDTTSYQFSIGGSGANQIWDFSAAQPDESQVTSAVSPGSTPYSGDFGGSNLALTTDNVSYLYFTKNTNEMTLDGAAGDLLGDGQSISGPFTNKQKYHDFPITYGTTFTDNYRFDVTADGSAFGVSDVRLTHNATITNTVDAWGIVKTPYGEYEALRKKRVDVAVDSFFFRLFPFGGYSLADVITSTTTTYTWLSRETKVEVIQASYDSAQNMLSITYTDIPAIPIADYSANVTGLSVNFSDQSLNTPTSWSWDFGDGGTSLLQNPTHTYTAPGTYTVCLTVTNPSGSDTYCNSVTVFDPNVNVDLGSDITDCTGAIGSLTPTVTGGQAPYTYLWSTGATTASISPTVSGNYSLTVLDVNSSSGSDNVNVTVLATPSPTVIVNGNIAYTAETGTYQWYLNGSAIGGETNSYITAATSGMYMVEVTNPGTGCTGTSSAVFVDAAGVPSCAEPTNLNAVPATFTSITLSWDPVASANKYEIRGKVLGTTVWRKFDVNNPSTTSKTIPGVAYDLDYIWEIRTYCEPEGLLISSWSVTDTFNISVDLPCPMPDSIWTTNITDNSATLNWTPVSGGVPRYEIRGRKAGSANVVTLIVNGTNSSKTVGGLLSGTNYEWGIRSVCNVGSDIKSDLTALLPFTTLSSGAGARSGLDEFSAIETLNVQFYPNPMHDQANIKIEGELGHEVRVRIYDLAGQMIYDAKSETGSTLTFDRRLLDSGFYLYEVVGYEVARGKFIVE